MKKLLSLLLIFLFLQTQVWALSGGPVFTLNSATATQGTFAGVVIPKGASENSTAGGANSLGVFSIGIPQVGVASGVFAYFSNGQTYFGTIVGTADPETLKLSALVKAQFNITKVVPNTTTTTGSTTTTSGTTVNTTLTTVPGGFATGSLTAEFFSSSNANLVAAGLQGLVRIKGKASLDVQSADVTSGAPVGAISTLSLEVDGYQQSATESQTTDLSTLTNAITTSSTSTATSSTGG